MTALMAAPTTPALADMHSEPTTHPPRLGQLVLILILAAHMIDLPAALTPRSKRRVELLIDPFWRLAVTIATVLITRPTTGPSRALGRLPARERRRLTLPCAPRLPQLTFQLADPSRSRSFSPNSREISPHNPSLSVDSPKHLAANRASSSTGSAGNTSTRDAVTATTTTPVRRGLHNPCSTR